MKDKLARIPVLRALACAGVFTSHCYLSVLGAWGVSVFIMLSGFLLVYNGLDRADSFPRSLKGCARYSIRKIKKLYPLYIFSLLTTLLILLFLSQGNLSAGELARMGRELAVSALLLQAWIPVKGWPFVINAVGWYLSACVVLYFAFPYILRRINQISGIGKAFAAIVGIYAAMIIVAAAASYLYGLAFTPDEAGMENFQHWFSYVFPLYRMGDFSIGCLLGYIFSENRYKTIDAGRNTALEAAAFALAAVSQYIYKHELLPTCFIYNTLFIPSTAMLIYAFALGNGWISRALHIRPIRFVADYSVEIFLLHCVAYKLATPLSGYVPGPYIVQRIAFVLLNLGAAMTAAVIWRQLAKRVPALAVK